MTAEEFQLIQSMNRTAKGLDVDPDELLWVYKQQEGKCRICKEEVGRGRGKLVADVDYNTGKLRGFLCRKHKSGLSLFNDDPNMLREAVAYLS